MDHLYPVRPPATRQTVRLRQPDHARAPRSIGGVDGPPKFDIDLPGPAVEASPRWVRVRAGGQWLADSRRALLLTWYGPGQLPTYCFPADDVRMDLLTTTDSTSSDGVSTRYDVRVGDETLQHAARVFHETPDGLDAIRDHVTFIWHDQRLQWFEEALQVHVHAKDPHKRVDAVPSERAVRVELDGTTIAESSRAVAVFETYLPTRWYFPPEDVRMDLFEATETVSMCPYKGTARWWTVRTPAGEHRDVAWSYPQAVVENPRVAGLVAFLNERIDLTVDGEPQRRPFTPWSLSSTG
jgi:uncharacterized protein (DUF427 family)